MKLVLASTIAASMMVAVVSCVGQIDAARIITSTSSALGQGALVKDSTEATDLCQPN